MTQAVFFDLDGTFADTAPDLAYALNRMRDARALPHVPLSATRPVTSLGARGMLHVGFGLTPADAEYPAMREEFLRLYETNLCRESRLFPGMTELIAALVSRGVAWGIVTNKAERYARPLIAMLAPESCCRCVIGGDTTPHLKPHPAPLLAASAAVGLPPESCLYVGDDERDIQAGRNAGMRTVAVRYGYLNGGAPDTWGADAVIDRPGDLLGLLTSGGT
ncbi:MAG: HAD family hydrolase [Rhodospirillaceae bacterium]